MFVKTLSCPEKLEWAERHRQNGNKLFARGQIMEAMDVYLTCLVACDTSTNTDKDDEKDDDDDKNKNASTKCNKADNDVNDGNGEDTVDIIDLSNSTSHDVIIETSIGRTDDDVDDDDSWEKQVEREVKLPVLLNLSLCTLKLSMYKKTCTFCDLVLEMECGKTVPKVYFRRGKARIHMGEYRKGKEDLQFCLKLLEDAYNSTSASTSASEEFSKMENSVKKELSKLSTMIANAEKNRARQEKAMKRVLGGKSVEPCDPVRVPLDNENNDPNPKSSISSNNTSDTGITEEDTSLYKDLKKKRDYSTLRAPRRLKEKPTQDYQQQQPSIHDYRNKVFVCCVKAVERSLRKILYWLGEDESMTRSYDEIETTHTRNGSSKKKDS